MVGNGLSENKTIYYMCLLYTQNISKRAQKKLRFLPRRTLIAGGYGMERDFSMLLLLFLLSFKPYFSSLQKFNWENLYNVFYSLAKWQEETHCFGGAVWIWISMRSGHLAKRVLILISMWFLTCCHLGEPQFLVPPEEVILSPSQERRMVWPSMLPLSLAPLWRLSSHLFPSGAYSP